MYQPALSYGIIHWGGAAKQHIKQIQTLQNRLIKFVLNQKNPSSYDIILNIQELYQLQLLDYVFKNNPYNMLPITEYFMTSNREGIVQVPKFNKYHSRIHYKGAIIYNTLPMYIKTDLKNFKKRRKPLIKYIKK